MSDPSLQTYLVSQHGNGVKIQALGYEVSAQGVSFYASRDNDGDPANYVLFCSHPVMVKLGEEWWPYS